ncbi:MAG TPA: hypothetical protein VGG41_04460 [Solirubrobacteraceae bacterium]
MLATACGVFAVCSLILVPPTVKLLRKNWSPAPPTQRWRRLGGLRTIGSLAVLSAIATVVRIGPRVVLFGATVVLLVLAVIETTAKILGKRGRAARER